MGLIIRKAVFQDVALITQFNIAMAMETEQKILNEETVFAGVKGLFDHPEAGYYVVAEMDGLVVGSLMITTEWSDWRNGIFWWIQSVYIQPEFRRQGIYRSLYTWIKDLSKDHTEVCGFRLYVEKENHTAQKTYLSLGMQPTHYLLFEEEY
jgi:ribosomal protein S18 acetylase RimI-like enzyme